MINLLTLDDISEHFERQLKEYSVDAQMLEDWKNDPVTRRLMLEISYAIFDAMTADFNLDLSRGMEDVVMQKSVQQGMKSAFELIMDWKPGEIA